MNTRKSTKTIVGALNLLTVAGPMLAPQITNAHEAQSKIEQLNKATLKSIESKWLDVPNTCKARAFNADPEPVETNTVSVSTQAIYDKFGLV